MKTHKYTKMIADNIESKLKTIMSIKYYYNLDDQFKCINTLSNEEKNMIYETMINDYLKKIEELKIDSDFIQSNKFTKKIDSITDFFVEIDEQGLNYGETSNEGIDVALDLAFKTINKKIVLPINISNIKDFSINNAIKSEKAHEVFEWIILELSTIYNYLIILYK